MSSPPPGDSLDLQPLDFTVAVQLNIKSEVTVPPKANAKSKKPTTKTISTPKNKEKVFHAVTNSTEDYVRFLQELLTVHGEKKYKVSSSRFFPFKYHCPPSRP